MVFVCFYMVFYFLALVRSHSREAHGPRARGPLGRAITTRGRPATTHATHSREKGGEMAGPHGPPTEHRAARLVHAQTPPRGGDGRVI